MTARSMSNSEKISKTALINGKVVTPLRIIPRGAVVIQGKKLDGIFSMDEVGTALSDATRVVDVDGMVIAPGFIDIHVHGGGGADLMDGTPGALIEMARAHAKGGSTAIVPSTVASSLETLFEVLDNTKHAKEKGDSETWCGGARIIGVHLEGPYLSAEQRGAMNPHYLKNPDAEEYVRLLDDYPDIVRVSAAPELPGALELGRELGRRRILASIGHSNATFDEVCRAVEAGYTHVTHLYSAMSGVRRISAYRVAGVIESGLLLDELTVEVIADGKHLPASLLKLIYKYKGADRIALITDAMRAAGMPEGEYYLGKMEDQQKVIIEDGVAKLPDRSAFAGSVATMNLVVKNMVELAGVSLTDAVKMATVTPARIIGAADTKGSLAVGKDADIVVFDERSLSVKMTIVEGRVAFNGL
ncbi:MAG: N-acetylglucosamine-6-phosphate deacetylase [Bacillota bacterium]